MLALSPLFLLLGLFLPGFFIAKHLRHGLPWASAFPISLVILFHSIFWLGILHVPITLWTVAPGLIAISAVGAWLVRRAAIPAEPIAGERWSRQDRMLIVSSGLVGAVLLVHSAIAPLTGGDTLFRWDFLAQRLLALGRFDFYPPLAAADFRTYFFVDGIPPLISFTDWWVYASAGWYLPAMTSVFVAAQFACTVAFTYGAASVLFSQRAGVLAAAMLAGTPLFFRSVVLGQETGMTALGIAATIYFVVSARGENDRAAMVLAGIGAGVCALSREYGWIAVIVGAIALLWRRQSAKDVVLFGLVAAAVAGPWYARNWMLAGNPFYSLRFLNFAVNPIHDRILHFYNASLGADHWTGAEWVNVLRYLLVFATLPVVAGIAGGMARFRTHGYLPAIAGVLAAVWLQSVGFTSGGPEISTRVLSPALVVLAIAGAGLLEKSRWQRAAVAAILVCQVWTVAQGVIYPMDPFSLRPEQWFASAFPRVPPAAEFQIPDKLVQIFPRGQRVLSDSAYLHAAMIDKGVEVVPVWSPEVRFLFSTTAEEAERRLRELHIGSVVVYPLTMNMQYLSSASPFYASLPERWKALAQVGDFLFILGPKN
ncbi:MAG: hypothetical protein JWP63_3639 [Candidatus Solibacter sp.]|nr:hypothetical protein [Candidatus Solibacter sp.]